MKRFHSFISIPSLLMICVFGFIIYFLYWKFQLGLVRYFDMDEYAYLWWASHLHLGVMPYRDFFFFATPGFLWFLTPIFVFMSGVQPLITARILMFAVYICAAIVLGLIFWEMRKSWIAVFAPLFLFVIPLPSDKFIEIRPDTLALVLYFMGMYVQLRMMNRHKLTNRSIPFFFVGVLYALSLVVFQKTVLFVCISVVCLICWLWMKQKQKELSKTAVRSILVSLFIGSCVIAFITGIWLLRIGNIPLIWYSLTKLPFEASRLGNMFPIPPSFFFFPNDVVYGIPGYHLGYWLNLMMWVMGIGIGIIRFLTPVVPHGKDGIWQEILLSGCFLISIIFFLFMTPFKHPQYLIPTAAFICFYLADGIDLVWQHSKQTRIRQFFFTIGIGIVFWICVCGYSLVNMPKLWWRNTASLTNLNQLFTHVQQDTSVLDLEGATMYYTSPYYISSLPIGQIVPFISLSLPSLSVSLEKNNTLFIYQGESHRLTTLLIDDQQYIQEHFTFIGDGSLLVRNDQASYYVTLLSK